jgi:hypothetical protein
VLLVGCGPKDNCWPVDDDNDGNVGVEDDARNDGPDDEELKAENIGGALLEELLGVPLADGLLFVLSFFASFCSKLI